MVKHYTVNNCENEEILTNILKEEWDFRGFVQFDFWAMKSTTVTVE